MSCDYTICVRLKECEIYMRVWRGVFKLGGVKVQFLSPLQCNVCICGWVHMFAYVGGFICLHMWVGSYVECEFEVHVYKIAVVL